MGPVRALSLALGALVLASGCLTPNPNYDPSSAQDGGAAHADGMADGRINLLPADQGIHGSDANGNSPQPDAEPHHPEDGFGAICEEPGDCAENELCLFTEPAATKGICLEKCQVYDEPCDVPDPKFFSGCAIYWNDDVGQVKVCAIFCKTPHGDSYPCPNETDYKCKVFESGLGMCVAKQ